MADLTGQQFGNYHLVGLLGQGGFADVYLGRHLHLHTHAAIKIHRARVAGYTLEHFRTEAQAIAHLVHPHIVRILDFGVENGVAYFVMDYAPIGSLRHRHPKGTRLSLTTIVSYVRQVAAALQYAHDQKLIHRDVKPENMLVGQSGEILLSDFGLVLPAQNTESLSTKEMAGTLAYMAPEQIRGKPRPASDQYALGIVMYEWLSGDQPFQGSAFEVYGQHLHAPPPSLCEKLPALAPAIERVVFRALAKEPRHRFSSIEAFATAFERACLPTLSQSSQSSQPFSSTKRKSPTQQSSLQRNQQVSQPSLPTNPKQSQDALYVGSGRGIPVTKHISQLGESHHHTSKRSIIPLLGAILIILSILLPFILIPSLTRGTRTGGTFPTPVSPSATIPAVPTPERKVIPTPVPSHIPAIVPTPVPTYPPAMIPTPTPSPSPSATPTPTPSPSPSATPTPTPPPTPIPTPSPSP